MIVDTIINIINLIRVYRRTTPVATGRVAGVGRCTRILTSLGVLGAIQIKKRLESGEEERRLELSFVQGY